MEFFDQFFNLHGSQEEHQVCCPFPHKNPDGTLYAESNPSASVNTTKRLFHCFACGTGMSEAAFLSKYQGISYAEALQILGSQVHNDRDEWKLWQDKLNETPSIIEQIKTLGFYSQKDVLELGYRGDGIAFPVFVYDELLDIRTYNPDSKPKVKSEKGAKTLILPFDLWRNDPRDTVLCAGEKDMAIARAYGFNAITFTGGENTFPKLFKGSFRGKKVYIMYDNDEAGIQGANVVATHLKDAGAEPYVVTGHHTVCTNPGGDIHDFFKMYGKSASDMQDILDQAEPFSGAEYRKTRDIIYPLVNLKESTEGKYADRLVSSRVAIIADFVTPYHVPEYVTFEKVMEPKPTDDMQLGETREWILTDANMKDILILMDSNIKENDVKNNLKKLCRINPKEGGVRMTIHARTNVFKYVVSDAMEREVRLDSETYNPMELTVYVLRDRLRNGEQYRIFYKPVAHPLQAQAVVGIISRVEESDNSVQQFQVTADLMESLKVFQGDPFVKMQEAFERSKAFCGVEANQDVFNTVELFYHTPLQFKFGERVERAYLEPMIIGESRTSKSQVAKALLNKYELGVFTSLKTSTKAGLIGGSDQSHGGYKTKLGIIPRNHKGAVIMEEFSGGGHELVSALTDMRSSNEVRIDRVNGSTRAPAMVRMLSISNQPVSKTGSSIPLSQYPNGVKVVLELVGAAEDIARYDFFILIPEPAEYIYPDTEYTAEPYPDEAYKNRVRWIWSRTPDQIEIGKPVRDYIISQSKRLNQMFKSHIKFFGTEAWKKLSRVAIAVAACCCSMDETGSKVIVTQEHVKWATQFLVKCYDNPIFKLKEYVEHQKKYTECTPNSIGAMQGLWNKHAAVIQQMENATELSRNQLRDISGLSQDDFSKLMNQLAECYFFAWNGDKIIPTQRFRQSLAQIDRNTYLKKAGSE